MTRSLVANSLGFISLFTTLVGVTLTETPPAYSAPLAQPGSPGQSKQQPLPQPSIPSLPESVPEAVAPDSSGILGLYPDPEDNIGIGQLRPRDLSLLSTRTEQLANANWLQGIALPIYVEPNGNHWGWIINGWLVPNGYEAIAIGRDAAFSMLHTYSELYSFPVMEVREDGWFRFQYTPAGTAWAHLSHLNLGSVELTIESWEDRFLQVEQVEFRNHGISQPLRSQPAADQSLVYLVGPNSLIEPLEFKGDWMRVRIVQPADGCEALPGANTEEGWMRWRSGSNRPLVWYSSKNCEITAQTAD